MAEKSAAKKEQQKNKKGKQNEKKKNKENGVKHWNEQAVHDSNHVSQKKKDGHNKNSHKSLKKKSGPPSPPKGTFKVFVTRMIYLLLGLGFLYLVDFEKFVQIRNGTALVLNKTISLLPAEVISKGNEMAEYIKPTTKIVLSKLNIIINQTSTVLNTNPLIKDHWTNIKEISTICSERLVDYIRTLYLQVTTYFHSTKR